MDRSAFVSAGCGFLRMRGANWASAGAARLRRPSPSAARSPFPARLASASASPAPTTTHGKKEEKQEKQRGRKGKAKPDTGPYSDTVNLPMTEFSQRANAVVREPQLHEMWAKDRVYERLSRGNAGEKFVLHDGPPFANGPLHCGHALNKTLKDFLVRYMLLRGRKATFVPGWDTHGLPIELKVLQSIKSKERSELSTLEMRRRAAEFAKAAVASQSAGFQRFGVWGDWSDPYLTLLPEYEAAQIGVFGDMYFNGHIYRGFKPVHWSPSSRTALAEAELEYPEGHTSRSCYCSFPAVSAPDSAPEGIKAAVGAGNLRLAVWTTTPWTMPANRAVAINKSMSYALVAGLDPRHPEHVIVVASGLVESVAVKFSVAAAKAAATIVDSDTAPAAPVAPTHTVLAKFDGIDLIGIEYSHAFQDGLVCRVVEGGDYITTETGTGLVHTAPGHGQEDYQTGLKEGLELASPVDAAGKFTAEAANGRFTGLPVLAEGNEAVLAALQENGILLLEESYAHKYPYDWRTKKPTIFRATEQWFASIDSFRQDALDAIEKVQWYPAVGIKRIRGMVESRGDWCLSRQRMWGLPIPVFYNDETGEPVMTKETVAHIQAIFAEHGSNAWWEMEDDELLPESFRGRNLRKGTDTMDVWFDSGTSWAGVSSARNDLQYPADLYLEGSDQHRGWFQSSMLTSVATRGKAPYKAVLTHGFVLDERGIKMSKSIGNVIDPLMVINGGSNQKTDPAYGADVLRLWVASVDYSGDVLIGPQILRQVSDVYRKLRNTMRYMVGNLHDYDPTVHKIGFEDLPTLDKFMLYRLQELMTEVQDGYDIYSFYRVYQALQRFAVVDLSNFYLDIAKDRLYIPEPNSFRRRSCQTVLAELLETYARAMAPILPHMAEDLWQNMPYQPSSNNEAFPDAKSVFEAGWIVAESSDMTVRNVDVGILTSWNIVRDMRDVVNKVLETARTDKLLGASMEAQVTLCATDPVEAAVLEAMAQACDDDVDELKRAFIVSGVSVVSKPEDVCGCAHHNVGDSVDESLRFAVGVDRVTSDKCDRCWHYDSSVGTDVAHPLLCDRCTSAVVTMGISSQPALALGVAASA
jgi:isoleucyl-tRNA synthetase